MPPVVEFNSKSSASATLIVSCVSAVELEYMLPVVEYNSKSSAGATKA